ncbi:hypothetical protein JCM16303_005020 [Sporobolomyces ruberrimus]
MSDPSPALVLLRSQTAAGNKYLITWLGILIWDWLSMLPVEYEHIWKPKKTLFTIVFLLNRYGTIFFNTLVAALILSRVPEAATRGRGLTIPEPVASYIDSHGCLAVDKPGAAVLLSLAYSMVPCLVNFVLLSLTIYRSWRVTRELEGTQLPILKRMVNDGILYFLCITVVTTLNIYFYVQPNRSIKSFNLCAVVVVSSTLSCRLALSLFVRAPTYSTQPP